ncbi:MAG: hypothetical protein ACK4RK_13765, partial [Gemmataceae bacterium]
VIDRGVIQATHLIQETKQYNIVNRSEHDRLVILEHPYRQQFELITPEKPSERTQEVYRFDIPVAAGKSASQVVTEQRYQGQSLSLSNTPDNQIRLFLSSNSSVISPEIKSAVQDVLTKKADLARARQDLQTLEQQLRDIFQDQARLRQNLKEMPATAAAYKKYLQKFDDQEAEIEKLQGEIKTLQTAILNQQKSLDTFLSKLSVN